MNLFVYRVLAVALHIGIIERIRAFPLIKVRFYYILAHSYNVSYNNGRYTASYVMYDKGR